MTSLDVKLMLKHLWTEEQYKKIKDSEIWKCIK